MPAENLVFSYAIMPLVDSNSINSITGNFDCLVRSLCSEYDQSTLNRFINCNGNWQGFYHKLLHELQIHKATKMIEDGIAILDSTCLAKRYSTHLQGLKYVRDESTKEYVKGYEAVVLCYSDATKIYPLDIGLRTVWNDKIGIAIKQIELMSENLPLLKVIAFDAWFFSKRLAPVIRDRKLLFVTKSKSNYRYIVEGVSMRADEILRLGKTVIAEREHFGKVKLIPSHTTKGEALLVTNDMDMTDERTKEIYKSRFDIDNPFIRDMKDQLNLEEFHMRKFQGIVAHCFLRFLSYLLVTVMKVRKGLAEQTIEWIKKRFISVVATIVTIGRKIRVILFPEHPP